MSKIKNTKGKISKGPPKLEPTTNETNYQDNEIKFELELYWCINQLEDALKSGKLNKKMEEDALRNIKTLKSKTAPLVKKRQTMKAAFGDYRTKMLEEDKKMSLGMKQIKFSAPKDIEKQHSFLKKAAFLNTDPNFRFNFTPATDNLNSNAKETSTASKLNLNSGGDFRFNFSIEDNLNISDLSIKN